MSKNGMSSSTFFNELLLVPLYEDICITEFTNRIHSCAGSMTTFLTPYFSRHFYNTAPLGHESHWCARFTLWYISRNFPGNYKISFLHLVPRKKFVCSF